jgi:dimethylaniline monooxygenase (N-oxide forming)
MFKHMLVPNHGLSVAFFGFVRPGVGSIPPCAEMQARYYALLLAGKLHCPTTSEMKDTIAQDCAADHAQYPLDSARIGALTDYHMFMNDMAALIGCQPPLRSLFIHHPSTWYRVMCAPISGAQFRLFGPGSDFAAADRVLKSMLTMPAPVLAYELLLLGIFKILSLLGLRSFAPLYF